MSDFTGIARGTDEPSREHVLSLSYWRNRNRRGVERRTVTSAYGKTGQQITILGHDEPILKVERVDPDIPLPQRWSTGAAAIDLHLALPANEPEVAIAPGTSELLSTGIAVEIPDGHFGLVTIRGGHGLKRALFPHVGIVDCDYRGAIYVRVFNPASGGLDLFQQVKVRTITGQEVTTLALKWDAYEQGIAIIKRHERFAQLTVIPYAHLDVIQVASVSKTRRGTDWGNSTGLGAMREMSTGT